MRLSSVSTNFNPFKIISKDRKNNIMQPLRADTFARSNEISFCGLSSNERAKIKSFKNDLYQMLFMKRDSDFKNVQELVDKYINGVDVKSIKKMPFKVRDIAAFYMEKADPDFENNNMQITERTIFLDKPNLRNNIKLDEYFVSAVHEFTHAVQRQSETMSCPKMVESYYDKHPDLIDEKLTVARECEAVAGFLKDMALAPINKAMLRPDIFSMTLRDEVSPIAGVKMLKNAFGIDNYGNYIKRAIDNSLQKLLQDDFITDKKFLLEYAAKYIECENEAYMQEALAYEKALDKQHAKRSRKVSYIRANLLDEASKIIRHEIRKL